MSLCAHHRQEPWLACRECIAVTQRDARHAAHAVLSEDLHAVQQKCHRLANRLKDKFATASFDSLPIHGHFVYVMRDERDDVLYVGVTSCLWGRLGQHATSKPKRLSRAAHLSVIRYETRGEADQAERDLIEALRPPLNVRGVSRLGVDL